MLEEQNGSIALVMLDMHMPEMNGLDVLKIMNKKHWIDNIPVIMISAEDSRSFIERSYELGVTDYIKRPFDSMIVQKRVQNTIMLYCKQKKLISMVSDLINVREKQNNLMISILSHIVEFRNGESGMHVINIRTITEFLLKYISENYDNVNLSIEDISLIGTASALHDIGKIAVPEHILNKPGRFEPEEYEIMKTHSAQGAEMLKALPPEYQEERLVQIAYQICRWHHERYDGRGYPDGLKGDEIPLTAQIVALADVYDALTSERVYKSAFTHEKAIQMIKDGECGCFNPMLLKCLDEVADQLKEILALGTDINIISPQETAHEIFRKNKIHANILG